MSNQFDMNAAFSGIVNQRNRRGAQALVAVVIESSSGDARAATDLGQWKRISTSAHWIRIDIRNAARLLDRGCLKAKLVRQLDRDGLRPDSTRADP